MVVSGTQPSYVDLMSSAYGTQSVRSAADFRRHHHEYASSAHKTKPHRDHSKPIVPTKTLLSPTTPTTPTRAQANSFETGFVMSSTPRRQHCYPELRQVDDSQHLQVSKPSDLVPSRNYNSFFRAKRTHIVPKYATDAVLQQNRYRSKMQTASAPPNSWQSKASVSSAALKPNKAPQSGKPLQNWSKTDVRKHLFKPMFDRKKLAGSRQRMSADWNKGIHTYDYDSDEDTDDSVRIPTYRHTESKRSAILRKSFSDSGDDDKDTMSLAQYAAKILEKHGIQAYSNKNASANDSSSSSDGAVVEPSFQAEGAARQQHRVETSYIHHSTGDGGTGGRPQHGCSATKRTTTALGETHAQMGTADTAAAADSAFSKSDVDTGNNLHDAQQSSTFASRYFQSSFGEADTTGDDGEWW